ncbi:ribosome production factor 2 homolog [Lineus longissimus]|uniref:ribosome production factor 2 homolog n=1 Tax=Lineus longissimus TaxID=88925 RepID=UPI002B4F91CD
MVLQRVVKPKNQRVKRALEKKEPKVNENNKTAMFIRGGRTSELITQSLKEIYTLKKPDAVFFKKKNIMRPFEDQTSIEFFSTKGDCSLFMFGSHSKKRPHNLVIGRLFDHHILDMVELGVGSFKSLETFKGSKIPVGTKPCLLFAGEPFETDYEYKRLKNLFIDFFRGPVIENIRLSGLEHVMMFTAAEGKVFLRSYKVLFKKSGCKTPRIELEEIGPAFNFTFRRTKLASDDLYKKSRKVPKVAKPKKKKNISRDVFGTKHGRIHMQTQDYQKLQTRKMKGLKRKSDGAGDTPAKKTKEAESS